MAEPRVENPVRLDFFQEIVNVHWNSAPKIGDRMYVCGHHAAVVGGFIGDELNPPEPDLVQWGLGARVYLIEWRSPVGHPELPPQWVTIVYDDGTPSPDESVVLGTPTGPVLNPDPPWEYWTSNEPAPYDGISSGHGFSGTACTVSWKKMVLRDELIGYQQEESGEQPCGFGSQSVDSPLLGVFVPAGWAYVGMAYALDLTTEIPMMKLTKVSQ